MSGARPHFGTAALRFSSDIVAWRDTGGGMRREKLPMLPGQRWMGIVLLFSSANGELLAIMRERKGVSPLLYSYGSVFFGQWHALCGWNSLERSIM
ncbi:MAG: hypothetical protein ACREQ2_17740 [Candidatus Binatia bacterium]